MLNVRPLALNSAFSIQPLTRPSQSTRDPRVSDSLKAGYHGSFH
jgi:hypothetical protein